MKKLILLIVFFFASAIVNIAFSINVYANTSRARTITVILQEFNSLSQNSELQNDTEYYSDSGVKDHRIAVLKAFFRRHESPLYEYADYIVKVSDAYKLDYRLVPAIAMQESTACKFIPKNSYNCWGWGIYGNKVRRFSSYNEGIEVVAKGIRTHYIDKGLTTPEAIMGKYTPSSNGSWARGVSNVLGVLE